MNEASRLRGPMIVIGMLLVLGTAGYMLIEGWSFLDALYMTVTTLVTVGFGEIHPLSTTGRIFTIGLIVLGVGGVLYTFTSVMQYVFEGHLGREWELRRMQRRIDGLRDHFILCGYGRVGRQVARDFAEDGVPFVLVDAVQERLEEAAANGCITLRGDATDDDTLRRAGIDRARGLVTCVQSDADNIFVTLPARAPRSDLYIVARGDNEDAAPKLRRAGADNVVSPYSIGGRQMAMLAVRPAAVEFVDRVFSRADIELLLEDFAIAERSPLVGRTLADIQEHVAPGVTVLAIRRDSRLVTQPAPETDVRLGDELVAFGTPDQLRALEGIA